MGHGKETPRQKMIGMMYLVLTALLALNVSAEVLKAFELIDKSLRNSAVNFEKKNETVYLAFEKAFFENPNKVKEWKDKADIVKVKSKELFDNIQNLKVLIVSTADGPEYDLENIQKKDDNNIPGEIMILKGNGKELQTKVETFRSEMIALIADTAKSSGIVKGINDALNTDPITDREGLLKPWDEANFNHLPLAGVVAMMSKMQADVRNVEADMLAYLYTKIDAGDFKFNKIEAIVKAPSNYIIKGNKYEAEVFIAASDTSVTPEIKLTNGSKLPVKEGKGIFSAVGSTIGYTKWGGVIELKHPASGEILKYPFNAEYQVAEPSLVVSPTKMNVFYIGVENPVDISVSGMPQDKVFPSISGDASITRSGSGYIVKVNKTGDVSISVSADFDGDKKMMGKKDFRVKRVPDPVATVGGVSSGPIDKNLLIAVPGIRAELANFDFALTFTVTEFKVSAMVKGFERSELSKSSRFTPQQLELIRSLPSGSKVYIESVRASGQDGSNRNLNNIILQLN